MVHLPMALVGKAVAKILEQDGYTVVGGAAPRRPPTPEDQKYTKGRDRRHGRASGSRGPTVTAGPIISEAGNDPNVAALVYIAAFALDEGDSCASIEAGPYRKRPRHSSRTATATGG